MDWSARRSWLGKDLTQETSCGLGAATASTRVLQVGAKPFERYMIWFDLLVTKFCNVWLWFKRYEWYDMICNDMITWFDMIWYDDMIWFWYDMIDMIWYDSINNKYVLNYDSDWYDMIHDSWYDLIHMIWCFDLHQWHDGLYTDRTTVN